MSDFARFPDANAERVAAEQLARYIDAVNAGGDERTLPVLSGELAELGMIARALASGEREHAPEAVHDALKARISRSPAWSTLEVSVVTAPSPNGTKSPWNGAAVPRPMPQVRPLPRVRRIWPYVEAAVLIAAVLLLVFYFVDRSQQTADRTPEPVASPVASPSPDSTSGPVGDCPVQGCAPNRAAPADRRVPADAPTSLWTSTLMPGVRGLVASGDHLYATDGATLVALDLVTGAERWRAALGVAASRAGAQAPVVAEGTVYFGASDGTIFAFAAADGAERWRRPLGEEVQTTVAVDGGAVYAGTADGHLYALDTATGEPRWQVETGPVTASSPVIADGAVFVGGGGNTLYSIDAATGRQNWVRPMSVGMKSVAVAEGLALVGSRSTGALVSLAALDADDASQVWAKEGITTILPPAIWNDTVYVTSGSLVMALDIRNGAVRWRFSATRDVVETVIAADTILLLRNDGAAIALDARTGDELWRAETGPDALALAVGNGVFYTSHADGMVSAYGPASDEER